MESLLEGIEGVIEEYDARKDETIFKQKAVSEELTELVNEFEFETVDWRKYVHYDKHKYTRNLIAHGRDNRFGLMVLAWGPGQRSPIHNHNGSHCVMRVLEGELIETLYCRSRMFDDGAESDASLSATDDTEMYSKIRETRLERGQTAYIHDQIGWHRVSNAFPDQPAVSLHLYAPPIEQCKTFCEVEGKVRAQAPCPYYSINGILMQKK